MLKRKKKKLMTKEEKLGIHMQSTENDDQSIKTKSNG